MAGTMHQSCSESNRGYSPVNDSAVILSMLKEMRKDQKEIRSDQVETKTLLQTHCEKFEDFRESMDPVHKDYLERQALKKHRSEALKSLSWKIAIAVGILTIVGTVLSWG